MENIVIVGGGSSGWLTACILASQFKKRSLPIRITLIESPIIQTIGVGEGTVPSMRATLESIGISETDFIRECNVTLKQSVKFINWTSKCINGFYHHPFDIPFPLKFSLDKHTEDYADVVGIQTFLCEHNVSPKTLKNAEFKGEHEYAYHLDSVKFGEFLSKHGVDNLSIKHLRAHIDEVSVEQGLIKHLKLDSQVLVTADLFIDCSGFNSLLLGNALEVPFIDKSDQLLIDSALALQVPYKNDAEEIPCYTKATACQYGWIWDIGLQTRRGTGYVYSSKFSTEEQVAKKFSEYLDIPLDNLHYRKIKMNVGYRSSMWVGNCVGIGLSSGFVEPLEATALLMVESTAKLLAELLPVSVNHIEYPKNKYNVIVQDAWDKVIDFIKLHYILSDRDDSEFWREQTKIETASDRLKQALAYWEFHAPTASDFKTDYDIFKLENYKYILFGMKYFPKNDFINNQHCSIDKNKFFNELNDYKQKKLYKSIGHRAFIESVKNYRMKKL